MIEPSSPSIARMIWATVLLPVLVMPSRLTAGCPEWNESTFFASATRSMVKRCLKNGADPVARYEHGNTPLSLAYLYNNKGAAKAIEKALDRRNKRELKKIGAGTDGRKFGRTARKVMLFTLGLAAVVGAAYVSRKLYQAEYRQCRENGYDDWTCHQWLQDGFLFYGY